MERADNSQRQDSQTGHLYTFLHETSYSSEEIRQSNYVRQWFASFLCTSSPVVLKNDTTVFSNF